MEPRTESARKLVGREYPDRSAGSAAWVHGVALRFISLASLVGVWLLLSATLGPEVLPGPGETFDFLLREARSGRLVRHVGATLGRVAFSFLLAMGAGIVLGVLVGASRTADRLFEAWIATALAIPRIVVIVAAYLLIGLNDSAAIAAIATTVLPTVVVQLREGTRAIDTGLVQMARAFRRTPWCIWRRVLLPQLLPYVIGTGRGALSLTWKMVVFAELMGRTSGVGYQIAFYYQMFNMRGILAYAAAMIVLLAVVDLGVMRTLEAVAFRWRRPLRLEALR